MNAPLDRTAAAVTPTKSTTPRGAQRRLGMFALVRRPRVLWRFLTDGKAPWLPRVMAVLALLYVVMPLDAVPDVVPFIGWLDDLGLASAALAYVAAQAARYENKRLEAATAPTRGDTPA